MEWETVQKLAGRSAGKEGLTVAWRRGGSHATNRLVIGVSSSLLAKLKWDQSTMVLVQRNRAEGMLRLSASKSSDALAMNWKQKTCVSIYVRMEGVTLAETIKAHGADAQFPLDGSLIIRLPDWAVPERKAMDGARAAQQAAVERAGPAPNGRVPYVGVTARVPDPSAGRRIG